MTRSGESDHSIGGGGVLLLEHAYRVGDGSVTCRLYRTPSDSVARSEVYEVRMEGFGEHTFATLGCDRSAARALYDTLVRNTVTPCALQDVMEDFWEVNPPVGLWE